MHLRLKGLLSGTVTVRFFMLLSSLKCTLISPVQRKISIKLFFGWYFYFTTNSMQILDTIQIKMDSLETAMLTLLMWGSWSLCNSALQVYLPSSAFEAFFSAFSILHESFVLLAWRMLVCEESGKIFINGRVAIILQWKQEKLNLIPNYLILESKMHTNCITHLVFHG